MDMISITNGTSYGSNKKSYSVKYTAYNTVYLNWIISLLSDDTVQNKTNNWKKTNYLLFCKKRKNEKMKKFSKILNSRKFVSLPVLFTLGLSILLFTIGLSTVTE